MIRLLAPLLLVIPIAGCGGGGHASVRESYAGKYVVQGGTTGGAFVLDVAGGKAEGSVAVGGTVYDFAGRIGSDGDMVAEGEGVAVRAHLASNPKGLSGTLSLSGVVSVEGSQAILMRADATN